MLVFPQWRPELLGEGCRVPRWMPAERFAPYLARSVVVPQHPPKVEDESSGGSSPEHSTNDSNDSEGVCGWRGCGARFTSVTRLSAHVARTHAHGHSDGLFYCGWKGCSRPQKGFNARYKMLVHVRTHTNERPHTCNQCNKSFSRAENLKIHLRSHSREKPYVCPYEGCGKAYSNSSDRFKHTRTHIVDKPYCCKVPGCNKRYTDPSSLRKHVKTFKHFSTEENQRRESSDEVQRLEASPLSEKNISHAKIEPISPSHMQIAYSPPRCSVSPTIPPYNPILPLSETSVASPVYTPMIEPVTYIRPIERIYPVRVPVREMSYIEYAQMYDHRYRTYYSNISYPVLTQSVNERYTYEEQPRYEDVIMEEIEIKDLSANEEVPLNLICAKRSDCHPIEEIVRRSDLPLDLSTKS